MIGDRSKGRYFSWPSKVLMVVQRFHPNLHEIDLAFRKVGIEVVLLVQGEGPTERETTSKKIIAPRGSLRFLHLLQLVVEMSPGVIIVRDLSGPRKWLSTIGFFLGIKVVGYSQSELYVGHRGTSWESTFLDIQRILINLALRFRGMPWKVFTPVKYRHRPRIRQPGFICIPFIAPPLVQVEPSRSPSKVPTLLYVGKLDQPRKRHGWLLDYARNSDKSLHLIFVGASIGELSESSYYQDLQEQSGTFGAGKTIEIHTNLGWEELEIIYRKASLFVFPAAGEPFGYSCLEAMAFGLPVLAGSQNGARFYLEETGAGLVFDDTSYDDFVAKLEMLLNNNQLLSSMSTSAASSASEIFTPEAFLRNFSLMLGGKSREPRFPQE